MSKKKNKGLENKRSRGASMRLVADVSEGVLTLTT
jgi:hypothetical protein